MRRILSVVLLPFTLAACAGTPYPRATVSTPAPVPTGAAPLAELVRKVDIPYETFTLDNGLTVLVHTDRKAPLIGVTTYYRVGSKHEPRGRTGFAHLFEHLMFGGSENVENFDVPLEAAGSTSTNGSTWYDRTNYVQTVPKGALDLALFMESDRMGHLLGAVTQDKLDKQRGVVQNEKRQGDNQPFGLTFYAFGEGLFPVGHPYRHSTIGSMADLDAASIADVRRWFIDHYGPNNVVLALAGDVDLATAKAAVERWYGHIPRGPAVPKVDAGPVTLAAPVSREMVDRVPVLRIHRVWSGPGLADPDAVALEAGLRVLGGLASSRLENVLVRQEQLAVAVSAYALQFEQTSFLQASMDVRPGVDRVVAEARLDALIAELIEQGPTEDELRRAATSAVAAQLFALEEVGGFSGKGAQLAEGQLFAGDPAKFKRDLERTAALTPAEVQAALARWLTRPVFALAVTPGKRTDNGAKMGGYGDEDKFPPPKPDAKQPAPPLQAGPQRGFPPVAPVGALSFPAIGRTTLSNGIPVTLARRGNVPTVLVTLTFDAGFSADLTDLPGTQSLMMALLDEGTTTRDATAIAEEQERLGARLSTGAGLDASSVTLAALTANLAPSLGLMADVAINPAFAPAEVERLRGQQSANLAQSIANPRTLARRTLPVLLFGNAHPYGLPGDGLGDEGSLKRLTPEALRAAHDRWIRPDNARITVVGDVTMAELQPMLEQTFGAWRAPGTPRPLKRLDAPVPAAQPRILLIDRPGSPQSVIVAGRVLDITGKDRDLESLELANEVLGGGFLSRLNLNLREDKGWSYGVSSAVSTPTGRRTLSLTAPVQSDRTGDSIKLLLQEMRDFPTTKPVDATELNRVTDGNVRGLPNRFETNEQVLGAIVTGQRLGRPDDYSSTLPDRYRAIDAAAIDAAAKRWLHPEGLVFVVVGDRTLVEPQLKEIGLPIEAVAAP
jgi:zinc protease